MKTINNLALSCVAAAMLLGLGGCAGMSNQDKNTAIGAGVATRLLALFGGYRVGAGRRLLRFGIG